MFASLCFDDVYLWWVLGFCGLNVVFCFGFNYVIAVGFVCGCV